MEQNLGKQKQVFRDVFAGLTLIAIAIPIDLGYASIAGMPPVTGIYALFIPLLLFAVFGNSRHLIVGGDSAVAAIFAAAIIPMAAIGSAEYAQYAVFLGVIVGVLLLCCSFFKLGFIAQFLSRTVLAGFLAGIGIQIMLGQLPAMLGISVSATGAAGKALEALFNLFQANWVVIGLSVISLAIILVPKLFYKRLPFLKLLPWPLLALVLGILAVKFLGLSDLGVKTVGVVQAGLPPFMVPDFSLTDISELVLPAITIVVVVITQSAAVVESYADKYHEDTAINRDLLGLGIANIGAALSGTFVVNGSPTKTAVADNAGGRSRLVSFVAGIIAMVVLLFFTPALQYIPSAVLAVVVFSTAISLVDIKKLVRIAQLSRTEFYIALATFLIVIFIGVAQGILIAILLSLINHLRRSYRPENMVFAVGEDNTGEWQPVASGIFGAPGTVVYHFSASLYYANVSAMEKDVHIIISDKRVTKLVFDFSAIADIDYTGGQVLYELIKQLKQEGITCEIMLVKPQVMEQLRRYGIMDLLDAASIFPKIRTVLEKVDSEYHNGNGRSQSATK